MSAEQELAKLADVPVERLGEVRLSIPGYKLILDHEVGGGRAYYERKLARPTWPGASSGITIGVGYDLGYNTPEDIRDCWRTAGLPDNDVARLMACAGVTGQRAKGLLGKVSDIRIPWEMAWWVFNERTLPRFIRATVSTFPVAHKKLSPDGFAALVSLVFNRGTALVGDTRREMGRIRRLIDQGRPGPVLNRAVADEIRSMKRLWDKEKLGGLHRRRDEEARLVEGGSQ